MAETMDTITARYRHPSMVVRRPPCLKGPIARDAADHGARGTAGERDDVRRLSLPGRGGPFVSQTCPPPPLPTHGNCRVRVIPTGGLSSAARAAMDAEAQRNTARAG